MSNPFAGLTEAQHCTGEYAKHLFGGHSNVRDPNARTWCAIGILLRDDLYGGDAIAADFEEWFLDKNGFSLYRANDIHGWTFDQFRRAWDEFIESRAK